MNLYIFNIQEIFFFKSKNLQQVHCLNRKNINLMKKKIIHPKEIVIFHNWQINHNLYLTTYKVFFVVKIKTKKLKKYMFFSVTPVRLKLFGSVGTVLNKSDWVFHKMFSFCNKSVRSFK